MSLQCIDTNGNLKVIPANKIVFNYRKIELDENLIFLSATFKGNISETNEIKFLMNNLLKKIILNHQGLKQVVAHLKIRSIKLIKKLGNLLKSQFPEILNSEMPIYQKNTQIFL